MPQIRTLSGRIEHLTDSKLSRQWIKLHHHTDPKKWGEFLDFFIEINTNIPPHSDNEPIPVESTTSWSKLSDEDRELFGTLLIEASSLATILDELQPNRKGPVMEKVRDVIWREGYYRGR